MNEDGIGSFHSVIAALVKAAIGESTLYVQGIKSEWDPGIGKPSLAGTAKIDITLAGEVTGSLTLSGELCMKVYTLYEQYKGMEKRDRELGELSNELRDKERDLATMKLRCENLEARLARLNEAIRDVMEVE